MYRYGYGYGYGRKRKLVSFGPNIAPPLEEVEDISDGDSQIILESNGDLVGEIVDDEPAKGQLPVGVEDDEEYEIGGDGDGFEWGVGTAPGQTDLLPPGTGTRRFKTPKGLAGLIYIIVIALTDGARLRSLLLRQRGGKVEPVGIIKAPEELIWIEGFDAINNTSDLVPNSGSWGESGYLGSSHQDLVAGRFAGRAIRHLNGIGAMVAWRQFSATNEAVMGFAIRRPSTPPSSNAVICSFGSGATTQAGAFITPDGKVGAYDANFSSTSNHTIPAMGWAYIELRVKSHSVDGEFSLWVDGQLALERSGRNTNAAGTGTLDRARLQLSPSQGMRYAAIDDFYLKSGGKPYGPCRVDLLYPTFDIQAQWTRGGGAATGTQLLSALPWLPATGGAVYTSGTTDHDIYKMKELGRIPQKVHGLKTVAIATKSAGTDELRWHAYLGESSRYHWSNFIWAGTRFFEGHHEVEGRLAGLRMGISRPVGSIQRNVFRLYAEVLSSIA